MSWQTLYPDPIRSWGQNGPLKAEVFQDLRKRWPVSIATLINHQCCPYFSPFHDPNALGTDAVLQNWNGWQAYAFPPWSLIPAVLKKLRSSSGVLLASEAMVPEPSGLGGGRSGGYSAVSRSSATTSLPSSSSGSVGAVASRVETIQRYARSQGFSKHVAKQSSLAQRSSSRAVYQAKWSIFFFFFFTLFRCFC